ncbi:MULTISPECIES: hypothetical protein [unclassified Neisseria]|uniref:hypothetical protein n=1 Tax=unclassified Neisseria TaxID=2623750 RepID=UPI0010718D30|nr:MULTISPECIES: hypothetical protein [unclassified Neisseria]MBF0803507.1 hypothetical protein [Neisseria sp. 19428wB4_WF04]TFU43791.1 hypothetical protein E4T99_03920 [Neisseria sp. WF04]
MAQHTETKQGKRKAILYRFMMFCRKPITHKKLSIKNCTPKMAWKPIFGVQFIADRPAFHIKKAAL